MYYFFFFFFFQAEDGIRDDLVTGVQTCALPISPRRRAGTWHRSARCSRSFSPPRRSRRSATCSRSSRALRTATTPAPPSAFSAVHHFQHAPTARFTPAPPRYDDPTANEQGGLEMAAHEGNGRPARDVVAQGLGWFSVALGAAQLAAPRTLARLIGIKDDDEHSAAMRAVGVREVATGVGILVRPRPAGWLWGRVVGDAIDLVLLAKADTKDRG